RTDRAEDEQGAGEDEPDDVPDPGHEVSAVDESRRRWEGGPRQRVRGVVNCGPAMNGRRTAILAAGEVRSGSRRSKPAERREPGFRGQAAAEAEHAEAAHPTRVHEAGEGRAEVQRVLQGRV